MAGEESLARHPADGRPRGERPKLMDRDLFFLPAGLVLLASAALLYRLRDSVSPAWLGLAILLLLYPYRGIPAVRIALGTIGLVFLLQLLSSLKAVLFPFVLSLGIAYLLDPLVASLARRGFPRTVTILVLDLLVLGSIVASLVILIPKLVAEVGTAAEQILAQAPAFQTWFTSKAIPFLSRFGLDAARLSQDLLGSLPARFEGLLRTILNGLISAGTGLSNLLGQLLTLVLVPFLTFYLLRDFQSIRHQVRTLLIPVHLQRPARDVWSRIDRILSGFFRGQLLVCLLVGVLTGLGLFVVGVRYSLALGILAGSLNIIPYVGITVTLLVAVLIGLFSPSPAMAILKAVLVIESVQVLEGSVLSPRIVGQRVGLHPAWVMLAVVVFSRFLGVIGLFLAVPVTAILKELAMEYFQARRAAERERDADRSRS